MLRFGISSLTYLLNFNKSVLLAYFRLNCDLLLVPLKKKQLLYDTPPTTTTAAIFRDTDILHVIILLITSELPLLCLELNYLMTKYVIFQGKIIHSQ